MKIGIYGGTFSPPHDGHVKLCREFVRFVSPDRMLIIPAGVPPHKIAGDVPEPEVRLEMCRSAFSEVSPKVEVSEAEVWMTSPSYTVDTLRKFAPEGDVFLLCGSDMFLTLDTWREPEEIFRLSHVVCGARNTEAEIVPLLYEKAEYYRCTFGADCSIMEYEPVELSSTEIRESIARGEVPRGICPDVMRLIRERGLYGCGGEICDNGE